VPREVYAATGASLDDLAANRLTTAWADALDRCVARTRACFEEGRLVCDAVRGRLRIELRLTWLGGSRILDRVERDRQALLSRRPALGARDVPALLWKAARWTRVAA
jgi:phytoene/squalene synthetase